jgi:hypothetical protein
MTEKCGRAKVKISKIYGFLVARFFSKVTC